MPTRDVLASFWRDWDKLTPQQQRAFREAVTQFIADLASGAQGFHPRLRVKRVRGIRGSGRSPGLTTAERPSSTARRSSPGTPRSTEDLCRHPIVTQGTDECG